MYIVLLMVVFVLAALGYMGVAMGRIQDEAIEFGE